MKSRIKQFIEISLGVLLLDIAYYFFFLPTGLVAGGTMGIAIILEPYLPFNTSIFLYIINTILLIVGLFLLGKDFAVKTLYATFLSPTIILAFEHVFDANFFFRADVQTSYLVAALVGSALTAAGLGICFRNNGTTGGMDVFQKILTKYFKIPYSKAMYSSDVFVILVGGISFKLATYNIEMVMYGILSVVIIGYLVDQIALNAKPRRTVYIITNKPEEIKSMLYTQIDRGVTECTVRGGYTKEDKIMIICTMDKRETYRIGEAISKIDCDAFTFITSAKEVLGNYDV